VSPAGPAPSWLDWSWTSAARGLTYALPTGVLLAVAVDVRAGVAAAVSVVPAAVIPLAPRRRQRVTVAVLGALTGVSVLIGSLLAVTPWLAVLGVFALSVAAAFLASRWPEGMVAVMLGLPLVAVGLSYPGLESSLPVALLLVADSLYAWLVSLPWPDRADPDRKEEQRTASARAMLDYGLRTGLVGALCAAAGFVKDFDHVGWAAGAALLVMRPSEQALRLCSIGRPVSVCVGAVAAIGLVALHVPRWTLGIAIVLVVVAATAMARSRWYVTPAFTPSSVSSS
jgi:hypothetical protein